MRVVSASVARVWRYRNLIITIIITFCNANNVAVQTLL